MADTTTTTPSISLPTTTLTPPTTTTTPTSSPTTTPPTTTTTPTTTPTTTTTGTTATTASTTASSTTTASSSSNASTPTTSSTTPISTSTGAPATFTITSFSTTTPTSTRAVAATSTAASSGSSGFFANTGAVAGVFTVVGLIVLAFIIVIITNTIRRRRAKKFDKELQEAAAVPAPVFLDDDEDRYNPRPAHHYEYASRHRAGAGFDDDGVGGGAGGGGGGGGTGYDDGRTAGGYGQYSDVSSHGTYAQPPMGHGGQGETYGMRELGRGPSPGPAPGELYNNGAAGGGGTQYGAGADMGVAGAAGIGVARARSGRDLHGYGYAPGLQDGASPYPAFATPGYQNSLSHSHSTHAGSPNPNLTHSQSAQELLEAAGMGPMGRGVPAKRTSAGGGVGGITRDGSLPSPDGMYNPHSAHPQQQPAAYNDVPANLIPGRTVSPPRNEVAGAGMAAGQKTPPGAESYASHYQNPDPVNTNLNAGYPKPLGGESDDDMRGAYGGFKEDYDDDYDAASSGEHGRRVLKVANE